MHDELTDIIQMTNKFEKLCSYLSRFDLENLALSSCLLSSMEYYNDWPNEYSYYRPMVNNAMANIFTKSLLYSDSNYFNDEKINRSSMPYILNSLVQTSDRHDIIENSEIDPDDKIDQIIMSMFSSQLWYNRDITKEKIGLIYSQYQEIPTEFRDQIQETYKDHFVDIPDFIKNEIGISLSKYLISCVYLIYVHYKELYNKLIEPTESEKDSIQLLKHDEDEQNRHRQNFIARIIEHASLFYHEISFSKNPLLLTRYSVSQFLGFLTRTEIDALFRLTSRNIFELRSLNEEEFHKKGHISQRLSPFERYPILKLDFPCYLIPNLRFFELGITELIRFELQQSFVENNRFHEVMGTVQELLILKLLSQLEGDDFLITPERTYRKNKSEYKGPDFIVIDKGRPILIESKAKQLLLDTRLKPDSKTLKKNIEVVTKALLKLNNEKYIDLYNLEIYSDIQNKLIDKNDSTPLFVGIMAEGPIAMQEQITKLKNNDLEHDLNNISHPHIFIDVFNFYKAIEICKTNSLSLYTVLSEYWNVGNNLTSKSPASEDFGGLKYDLNNSFSKSRYPAMMEEIFSDI